MCESLNIKWIFFYFNFILFKLDRVHEYEKSLDCLINVTCTSNTSSRSNSVASINSNSHSRLSSSNKYNEINNSNLEYWRNMKEKCEKVII